MYIADNAKCNIIVVEDDYQLQKILKVWHQLPDLKAVIQYKDIPAKKQMFIQYVFAYMS